MMNVYELPESIREKVSSEFDEEFYKSQLEDKVDIDDALRHYFEEGWLQGMDPNPNFSTRQYLNNYNDVRDNAYNPFWHYVAYGKREGRKVFPSHHSSPIAGALLEEQSLNWKVVSALVNIVSEPNSSKPKGDVESRIVQYLNDGWKNLEHRKGEAGREQKRSRLGCETSIEVLLDQEKERLSDEGLVNKLKLVVDEGYYSEKCQYVGVPSAGELGMPAYMHYLSIGRHFKLPATPLFDAQFYARSANKSGFGVLSPALCLIHFLEKGEKANLRPNSLFNTEHYEREYGSAGLGAFAHYASEGKKREYSTSPAFWSSWYKEKYNIVGVDPLFHFFAYGMERGYSPNPLFDPTWYSRSQRIKSSDSIRHYVLVGFLEDRMPMPLLDPELIYSQVGRGGNRRRQSETLIEYYMRFARSLDPHPLFETDYYLRQNSISESVDQPLYHYLSSGVKKPKFVNPFFSDATYYKTRKDVARSGIPALLHYVTSGGWEEVDIHPLVDHKVLKQTAVSSDRTPLELLLERGIENFPEVRQIPKNPETDNYSRWLRVALDVDGAAEKCSAPVPSGDSVCVIAHVFYPELMNEVLSFYENLPEGSALLISTDTYEKSEEISRYLSLTGLENWEVRVFSNRGRDIAPSFIGYRDKIESYKYCVHIHTKKSLHYGAAFDKWRRYLYSENGGSSKRVSSILKVFESNPSLGALAPVDFGPIRNLVSWGYNRRMAEGLLELAGIRRSLKKVSLEFPTGSMFWFRTEALRSLFKVGLGFRHFDPERGQVDGTLAHAVERAFFLLVEAEGYDWARFCSGNRLGGYQVTDEVAFARSRLIPRSSSHNSIHVRFPETAPFFCRAIENEKPRLNLLIPTCDLQVGYAGVSEAIRQFRAIGERMGSGVDLRIISTDTKFTNMTVPPHGFTVVENLMSDQDLVVVPGHDRDNQPLGLRPNDYFVASAWWTAKQAYGLLDSQSEMFGRNDSRRIVYLIQDFEPGFYPWSTRYALAESTYLHSDRTIALFNTPLLADFMKDRYSFSSSYAYHPIMNEDLVVPKQERLSFEDRHKIVLLYARPHAERNCLEIIDGLVSSCVNGDPEFWADWKFLAVGENFSSEILQCQFIEVAGRLTLDEYRSLLGTAKLGVSIMVSPHPSYPPLEMAGNGVRVLTNVYEGKDLSKLHGNIESFQGYDVDAMAVQLREMAEATSFEGRPLVDWFFDGRSNIADVSHDVALEVWRDLGRAQ